MNRVRISTPVLLSFLVIMFLVVVGCSGSSDTALPTTTTTGTFTQADLVGTWNAHQLEADKDNGVDSFNVQRVTVAIDSSGLLAFSSCFDGLGDTSCPTSTILWTIAANGVISATSDGTSSAAHYTMTSNNNFIAGTQGNIGSSRPQLLILQKVVSGTTYASADLYNTSFVWHRLRVGIPYWDYGAGTIDNTGLATPTSETTWFGPATPGSWGTLAVDGNGVVTMSGNTYWSGFLSADKKTIVAVEVFISMGGVSYALNIIQITGRNDYADDVLFGTLFGHMLATGGSPTPFWAHQTITVASGVGGMAMSYSDWLSSNSSVTGPTTIDTGSISSSGTVAINGSDFHGQISDDGMFMVGTQTFATGIYSLIVVTR
jgi:hypothetical protein